MLEFNNRNILYKTVNFQQLRYVRETVRQGLNLTEAAKKLFTSQPGVSKQIRELENELGVEIFVRHGKRIVAVTEPGKAVVEVIERLLQEAENLKQVGREFKDQAAGTLTIATTHTQARYSLPKVVGAFKRRYPRVHLTIKQGNPPQLAEMVIARAGGRTPVRHHDDPGGSAPRRGAARLRVHLHRAVLAAVIAKVDRNGVGRQGRNVRAVVCCRLLSRRSGQCGMR